jgi:hypothetical protein
MFKIETVEDGARTYAPFGYFRPESKGLRISYGERPESGFLQHLKIFDNTKPYSEFI